MRAFLAGIVVAIASSVPVGPINFAIMQAVFTRGKRTALLIGLGGMLADAVYSFLGLLLFGALSGDSSPAVFQWINLITIPVVIFLGIHMIRKRHEQPEPHHRSKAGNSILAGIILGISNPMLFAYWLWVASYVQGDGWVDPTMLQYVIFALGVTAGIGLFFLGFVNLLAVATTRATQRFRATFSLLVGLGFIGFGIFLTIRHLLAVL